MSDVLEGLVLDPDMEMLNGMKTDGYNYRQRRQDDWLENYTLSRDRVLTNRLTQRQTVNLPMMKTVLRTLLKDVDDMPALYFENLDNDKQAEVFKNEYWKKVGEVNKFELQDIVDKRQVFHFGRSFDQWQIMSGMPRMTITDPQDILVSRYIDPTNIHSSRFLDHTHIYVPLAVLEENEDYDKDEIQDLKRWYATELGLIKQADNLQMKIEKDQKLSEMGMPDVDSPLLGETWVEITLSFVHYKEKGDHYDQIYLFVTAEDRKILMKKPLEQIVGKTSDNFWRDHYPYNSWADDVERQDFWSDGIADIVRTPNKILNVWFSQLVENRTLRSFGMNIYNSSKEGFSPQMYEPMPFGWYGMPLDQGEKLSDVYQKVDIPDLSESLDEMEFVIGMVEKASGATATEQGTQTERQVTLGEVQLALGEAKARIKGMEKFYTQVWKERGEMFYKLIEAAPEKLDAVKIYKKGRNTDNIYGREISPSDWMTKSGYRCRVWSQAEKNEQDTNRLEKLNAVKTNMPDNPVVDEEYKRKLLEFADFSPDKLNDAMKYEQEKRQAALAGMMGGMPQPGMPGQVGAPQPALPAGPQGAIQ
jgi:hypothetical protein